MMEKKSNIDLESAEMKKIPFSVPEGYLESVEERLRQRITESEPKERKAGILRTLKASLTLAASFLLVAAMGWGVMRLTNLHQEKIAAKTEVELNEDGSLLLDSLINKYSAIEIAEIYRNAQIADYKVIEDYSLTDEEIEAVEEYITLRTPSFPGLVANELSEDR